MTGPRIRPVTATDWPLVERLFGGNGACGGCWCRHWHAPGGERAWAAMKGEVNRQALRAEVEAGTCTAMLALDGDMPVGWCRFGPRADFPRLQRSRTLRTVPPPGIGPVWAVVCFYIPARQRGCGIATRLLSAATAEALRLGAGAVEGYAVVPRGQAIPAAFAWTGVPALFEAAGYTPVPADSGARRIYRFTPS